MHVFVTGGTGAIGRYTVPALVAAGREVTALARGADKAAALAARVPVVVQESVAMLYRPQGDAWIDETMPVDHYPNTAGNFAAEANAQRFTEAGRTGISLRFGLFYGQGAAHSEQMLAQAKWHIALMLGPADAYQSSIHVADGAEAVAAVLNAEAGTYNVVDDEPLTKREFADALAAAVHTTPWLRPPGRAALLLGDRLTALTRSLRVSNKKLHTTTGWTPRYPGARRGLAASAVALDLV